MKKVIILSLIAVFSLALTSSVAFAGGNGAVKVDLTGPYGDGINNNEEIVGSVILNTTASGKLIAVVNMDGVANMEDWDVNVSVVGPGKNLFHDVLSTNDKGQGNATLMVDLSDYDFGAAETISVQVTTRGIIKPVGPQSGPYYENHVNAIVPLK